MSGNLDAELAIWFAKRAAPGQISIAQQLMLDEVQNQIRAGKQLEVVIQSMSKNKPQAGDFGADLGGSLIAIFLLETLRDFFKDYVKKVQEKLSDQAAEVTVDVIKKYFLADISGPMEADTKKQIKEKIEAKVLAATIPQSDGTKIITIIDQTGADRLTKNEATQ